jgi:hypothetical protein
MMEQNMDTIDLGGLDPDDDPEAARRFVTRVMADVARQGAVFPAAFDPLWGVWSLARPIAVAAALVLALIGAERAWTAMTSPRAPHTVAESLGVPPAFEEGR